MCLDVARGKVAGVYGTAFQYCLWPCVAEVCMLSAPMLSMRLLALIFCFSAIDAL